MRFSTLLIQALSLTASLASAVAIEKRQSTTQVYKFSSPTSAEGIAVRSNGQLLVSFFDKAELWTIDPATKKATKLVSFEGATCSAGIAEIAPDVFAVVAGQFSFSGGNKAGSWAIWKVDFTSGTAVASVLKKVPESGFFNGLTTFDNSTILIGDASKGAVWRMDTKTGAYSIAIQDALMNPAANAGIPMGLDGLRYSNGTVWFTNVSKNSLHKVAVDATGKATGSIATIWSNTFSDDLWVGSDGSAYVATGSAGKIQKVSPDGKVSTVASVSGSTAVVLGRTEADKNTLYIATGNGLIASVKV
ncbi:NHL repeat-containing protein [Melanomma pulvis-pyrius CBS 109.77]|uniref:NHL repeat-containing protein n=1 Tax=Melanomma pulvis-pyrius CBS 109.77 TaxID=1314802 RepID=A0A6A6WSS4_9PLEO|nr:NHL repeat-containing protein [Melanomma pulvis-pyrius CBS 109.77]